MRQFTWGVLSTLAILGLGCTGYLGLGRFPIEVDAPALPFEAAIAEHSLEAALRRKAPTTPNPLPATAGNLAQGKEVYDGHCSGCHGERDKPDNRFATQVFPPIPQFFRHAPDLPPGQLFYLTKHGIRLTAMPAFGIGSRPELSDEDIWKVTLYLSHLRAGKAEHAEEGERPGGRAQQPGHDTEDTPRD